MNFSDQDFILVFLPLLALASLCLFLLVYSFLKHQGDLINPVTSIVFLELFALGLLSTYSSITSPESFGVSAIFISRVLCLHIIYGMGFAAGYFVQRNPLQSAFRFLLNRLNFSRSTIYFKAAVWFALLGGAITSFLFLVLSDIDDLLWVTSPREAYISLRSGLGHWWLLYQACVVLAFLIALHGIAHLKHRGILQLLAIAVAASMMYFTGSKTAVLLIPIIAAIYLHFYHSRLSLTGMAAVAVTSFAAFTILLGRNGEQGVLGGIIRYFADYVSVTALAVELIDFHGHTFGFSSLSSLWYFVPRGLFPEKPFEYGATLLHSVLFPGSAELGHTPGILPWLVPYMDFGVFGVITYSVLLGSFCGVVYQHFQCNRDLGSFLLMTSFCFVPPLASGQPALYILLSLFLWAIFGKPASSLFPRKSTIDSCTYSPSR